MSHVMLVTLAVYDSPSVPVPMCTRLELHMAYWGFFMYLTLVCNEEFSTSIVAAVNSLNPELIV